MCVCVCVCMCVCVSMCMTASLFGLLQVATVEIESLLSRESAPSHGRRITQAKFAPNGQWLALGCADATVYLHDVSPTSASGHCSEFLLVVVGVRVNPSIRLLMQMFLLLLLLPLCLPLLLQQLILPRLLLLQK